jgi:hypothetical protein
MQRIITADRSQQQASDLCEMNCVLVITAGIHLCYGMILAVKLPGSECVNFICGNVFGSQKALFSASVVMLSM